MSCLTKVSKKVFLIGLFAVLTSVLYSHAYAQDILRDGHPDRYTVKKGDTLWDISAKFLNDPWRWTEIWSKNSDIENPDLIFPGDLLVLTFVDGKPVLRALKSEVVKLKPTIRTQEINKPVPTISPSAIKPFLVAPLVTSREEVLTSAYIVDGFNNRLVGGKFDQMYARRIKETEQANYQIFRSGRMFIHPETKEELGFEAIDIGTASLARAGDPARIRIKSSRQEVEVEDRLRPMNEVDATPFFFPSAHPDTSVSGYILPSVDRTPEIAALDRVIAISVGSREGVEPGQVFKVLSKPVTKADPVRKKETFTIPEEEIGLVMVFRVFDKVSYAIVTDIERPLTPGDKVAHPQFIK